MVDPDPGAGLPSLYACPVPTLVLDPAPYFPGQLGVPSPEREGLLHKAVVSMGQLLLPKGHRPGTLLVIPELALGSGRPDVAVAAVDIRAWKRRLKKGVAPLTAPLPVTVACALDRFSGEASLQALAETLPRHSHEAVAKGVRELGRAGWLESDEASALALNREARKAGLLTMAAVEAKVGNWRQAARQAISWINQVDAAWLAFPSSYMPNVPRRDPYLSRFGLIAVDDAVSPLAVRRPRSPKARGIRRRLSEEHLYARWSTHAF